MATILAALAEALEALYETVVTVEAGASVAGAAATAASPLIEMVDIATYGSSVEELGSTAVAAARTAGATASSWLPGIKAAIAAATAVDMAVASIHDSAKSINRKRKRDPPNRDPQKPLPSIVRQLFKDHAGSRAHKLDPAHAQCYEGFPNLYTRQYVSPLLIC